MRPPKGGLFLFAPWWFPRSHQTPGLRGKTPPGDRRFPSLLSVVGSLPTDRPTCASTIGTGMHQQCTAPSTDHWRHGCTEYRRARAWEWHVVAACPAEEAGNAFGNNGRDGSGDSLSSWQRVLRDEHVARYFRQRAWSVPGRGNTTSLRWTSLKSDCVHHSDAGRRISQCVKRFVTG